MTAPQGQEEYVPTTEQVRTGYATGAYRFLTGTSYSLAAFDRWLAAHDAEVAARALREAADDLPARSPWMAHYADAVRHATGWLITRADRIERQEATR